MKKELMTLIINRREDIITEVPKAVGMLSGIAVGSLLFPMTMQKSEKKHAIKNKKKKDDKNKTSTIPMKDGRIDISKLK